jgi:proteasome lid subunit RPN8/RPN11
MKITDALLKQIYTHGQEVYPGECFGFLIGSFEGSGWVHQVKRGTNLNTERNDRFEMDGLEFVKINREVEEAGLEVVGFYHSHPDWPAIPSQTDISFAQAWRGYYYIIVSIFQGRPFNTGVWIVADDEPARFIPLPLEIVDERELSND